MNRKPVVIPRHTLKTMAARPELNRMHNACKESRNSGCIYCFYETKTAVVELNVRCVERNGFAVHSSEV